METNVARVVLSIADWLDNQDESQLAAERFTAAFGEQADSTGITIEFLAFGEAIQQAA